MFLLNITQTVICGLMYALPLLCHCFAIALALGGTGKNAQCVQAFQGFIKEYPDHPLTIEVKTVVTELK